MINLEELKVQFKGKTFNQLIEYHLRRQGNTKKLREAAVGCIGMLPQSMQSTAEGFIDKWNERAYDESFWQRDSSDVFSEVIEDARSLLSSFEEPVDDETLFNMFQIVVLSYAYSASDQPAMRRFITGGKVNMALHTARTLDKIVFKRGLILASMLMVIWAFVLEFIPEGWWVLVINIFGILLTYWILLSIIIPFFKGSSRAMSTIIAVIASGALWFVMFVAVRFIIGVTLGTN